MISPKPQLHHLHCTNQNCTAKYVPDTFEPNLVKLNKSDKESNGNDKVAVYKIKTYYHELFAVFFSLSWEASYAQYHHQAPGQYLL